MVEEVRVRVIDRKLRVMQCPDLQPPHGVDVDECEDPGIHWYPRRGPAVARHWVVIPGRLVWIGRRPCSDDDHGNPTPEAPSGVATSRELVPPERAARVMVAA